MNTKNLIAVVAALTFGLQAAPAAALSVSVGGDDDTNTSIGSQTHIESEAEFEDDAHVVAPARVDSSANVSANVDAAGSVDQRSTPAASASTNTDPVASVKVSHKEPGKLFGFIPVMIDVTARADQSGNVTLSYPWYSVFITIDNGLQSAVQDKAHAVTQGGASLDAQTKANLQSALLSALESFSASAEASSSVAAH